MFCFVSCFEECAKLDKPFPFIISMPYKMHFHDNGFESSRQTPLIITDLCASVVCEFGSFFMFNAAELLAARSP